MRGRNKRVASNEKHATFSIKTDGIKLSWNLDILLNRGEYHMSMLPLECFCACGNVIWVIRWLTQRLLEFKGLRHNKGL